MTVFLAEQTPGESALRSEPVRCQALDVARGAAIFGMFGYHGAYDLAFFGLNPGYFPFVWPMRLYAHATACAFLAIAGVSLALASRDGFDWPRYFHRLRWLIGAAALVTLVSYLFAGDEVIAFGILHCIAAASVLGAVTLRWPAPAGFAIAAFMIVAPIFAEAAGLRLPWPLWVIGLSGQEPNTLDWRPLMPWSGALIMALSAARSQIGARLLAVSANVQFTSRFSHVLVLCGRHSLVIYLVHQPILMGGLFASFWMSSRLHG